MQNIKNEIKPRDLQLNITIKPRDLIYVKDYRFLFFAKNMGKNIS